MQTIKKEDLRRVFATYINGDVLTICDAKNGRQILMTRLLVRAEPELIGKFSDKLQVCIAEFVKDANWVNATRNPRK